MLHGEIEAFMKESQGSFDGCFLAEQHQRSPSVHHTASVGALIVPTFCHRCTAGQIQFVVKQMAGSSIPA